MINRIILFVPFPAPIFFAHQINTLKLLRAKSLIGCGAWAVQGLALCQMEGQDSGIKSQDFFLELVYIPPSIVYFGTRSALQYNPLALKIASASKRIFCSFFWLFPARCVRTGSSAERDLGNVWVRWTREPAAPAGVSPQEPPLTARQRTESTRRLLTALRGPCCARGLASCSASVCDCQ